ncbi:MAG TPA: transcription initiation factor IIB [Candidatus Thermoplasmatota archaeon]|jgi:transcription initiation factor TFIIB|nr:transcription initiation factor IIB [Candidatus Thermoplasmatota archaeon]
MNLPTPAQDAHAERSGCPECGSTILAQDDRRGELVCQKCGLVLEDHAIDPGPEWRSFDSAQHEKRARTGAPATWLMHDKGLSTNIGWADKDGQGRAIPARSKAMIYRLRRWQRRVRVRSGGERSLVMALSELDRMASRIGLPRQVRETAALIYRRAAERKLLHGRSIEGMAAASLYAACRQHGVPRALDEICVASRASRKVVGRTYRLISRELKLKLGPTSPLDYVPRFASTLDMAPRTQVVAAALIRQALDKGLANGKSPTGMAAAALYIAGLLAADARTQQKIAEAAGVTEVTIRNHYQVLASELVVPEGLALPAGERLEPALRELQRAAAMVQAARPRPPQRRPPPGRAREAAAPA